MRIRDPGWRQFGSRIRDGKKSDLGSGIRDKHPGSATLPAPLFRIRIWIRIGTGLKRVNGSRSGLGIRIRIQAGLHFPLKRVGLKPSPGALMSFCRGHIWRLFIFKKFFVLKILSGSGSGQQQPGLGSGFSPGSETLPATCMCKNKYDMSYTSLDFLWRLMTKAAFCQAF